MLLVSRSGARAGAIARRASAGFRSTLAPSIGALLALLAACQDPAAPATDGRLHALDASAPRVSASAAPDAGDVIPDEYIVTFKDDERDAPGLAKRLMAEHGGTLRHTYTAALKGFAAHLPPQAVEALRRNPQVALVEADAATSVEDVQASATWGLDRIDQRSLPLDRSYSFGFTGAGVTVYIVDSGIRFTHAEFEGRALRGIDVIGDGRNGDDCHNHGTHVAGTVASRRWGVAKQATVVSVRVSDCNGSGTVSGAIAGLDWIAKNRKLPAVANMSMAAAKNASLDAAVRAVIASGVQVAIAAGNSNIDACTISPASQVEAVTVGAAGTADINDRQSFSNWGDCVDIFAPGSLIVSASNLNDTSGVVKSGTSMAAPHAAGVMALWLHQDPLLSPAQLQRMLVDNATKNVVADAKSSNAHMLYSVAGAALPQPSPTAPPAAAFTVNCVGLACSFDASGSVSVGSGIVSFAWDLGDGGTAAGVQTSHSYAAGGSRTVTLTVRDANGLTGKAVQSFTVSAPNQPPTPSFTVACRALTCAFTDRSGDADGSVTAWRWNMGDGTVSTATSPVRGFAQAGTYVVTLSVTDDRGATASAAQAVVVAGGISLAASQAKVKRQYTVNLAWSGAAGNEVAVYRNGSLLRNVSNSGTYSDATGSSGRADYRYRVCEFGGGSCSAEVLVQLR